MHTRQDYSHAWDLTTGLICDDSIALNGSWNSQHYPERLRRIRYKDPESANKLVFLPGRFGLSALAIYALYS